MQYLKWYWEIPFKEGLNAVLKVAYEDTVKEAKTLLDPAKQNS